MGGVDVSGALGDQSHVPVSCEGAWEGRKDVAVRVAGFLFFVFEGCFED